MKKKILIIDDKEEFRKLTKTILSSKYEVMSADDGIAALSLLQSGFFPDMIVSDMMMPGLGGIELVSQVKESGAFKNIPVIILSSINEIEIKTKLLEMGAADYLIKPYNPKELLERIDKILND